MKLVEMDNKVGIRDQLDDAGGPVILINTLTIDPTEADALLRAWAEDAAWMKSQPGFISTQPHRGIAGSGVFLNYAVWELTARFKQAFTNPEFQAKLTRYAASTVVSPHLFRKIAVPDICGAD